MLRKETRRSLVIHLQDVGSTLRIQATLCSAETHSSSRTRHSTKPPDTFVTLYAQSKCGVEPTVGLRVSGFKVRVEV